MDNSHHNKQTRVKHPMVRHRVGGWLPKDHRIIERWMDKLLDKVDKDKRTLKQLHPVIVEFKELIDNDPALRMGFTQMFDQVPTKPPYNNDPTLKPQIRDYDTMLKAFDCIITHSLEYEDNDLVGFPINAILDWPMGTVAGLHTFTVDKLNVQFKKMLAVWFEYLSSEDSRYVLTTADNGWFGPKASEAMPDFIDTFECDPSVPYYGFKSWDDFFTRSFRKDVRPIYCPDNNSIINSACESAVYRISYDVKITDKFWLKGEPYSLHDMLYHDEYTPQFVGGTVYQAFLSALKYHRWASPVNGTIERVVQIPGTYYAESPAMGFENPDGPDPAAPNLSQGYITSLAARALIWIKADNSDIGLMGFLAVGMCEVSTCEVTVNPGDKVKKGDQLGMFHFGGSTHCLIFRPETKITFDPQVIPTPENDADVLLNAPIAWVGDGVPYWDGK
ncbi:hypothetical protein VKT23_012864 [Stygiomarasmius scandens]|uniref:L-tryptophan decarboxylase PsiD-like domain-containing protein n=1 Tax=Marasmiellus scandens TaxID=2682957 RepID=A0ABR1J584_9AGAR